MADLNQTAKRIHNISPRPVRLTLEDGTEATFRMDWVEFFQQEFKGEGSREDEPDVEYRFISSDDNESVLVGRKGPNDDGWSMIGSVLEAEAVDDTE
ncbi:transcriptional regulator [Natrialbaceae archaeon A-CW3]